MRIPQVLTLIVAATVVFTGCDDDDSEPDEADHGIPSCSEAGTPLFTALPLPASDFRSFVPLGNFNPPGHVLPTPHHYLYLTDHTTPVPVTAPGPMWITSVSSSEHSSYTDYGMDFQVCDAVSGTLGHLSSLAPEVLDAIGGTFEDGDCESYEAGGTTYHMCRKTLLLEVEAGTVIGTAGGNPGQYALDLGVYDERVTHTFSDPSRFVEAYTHAVPCLDYYDAGHRAVLESKCARTMAPIGGTVAYDVVGTAQGVWFRAGEPTYPESPHLALAYDNIDPAEIAFVTGTSIEGLPTAAYTFTVAHSGFRNRAFADVTADGNVYTYDGLTGPGIPVVVVLMQLVNARTLWVEAQSPSSGPPWMFTSGRTEFER